MRCGMLIFTCWYLWHVVIPAKAVFREKGLSDAAPIKAHVRFKTNKQNIQLRKAEKVKQNKLKEMRRKEIEKREKSRNFKK